MGDMIEFASNGDTCSGYLAVPERPGPGVVVIQEWWGCVDHIKGVADRFAAEGFVALAPDLYHGESTTEPDEAGKMLMSMKMERTAKDMSGAVDFLEQHPVVDPKKVGAVGFCAGGGLALMLAAVRPVAAVSSFYPAFAHGEPDYSSVSGAVLIHGATHDDWMPPAKVETIVGELRSQGVNATAQIYPDTHHAFFNDERPEVYNPSAAQTAWNRTLDLFRENLR